MIPCGLRIKQRALQCVPAHLVESQMDKTKRASTILPQQQGQVLTTPLPDNSPETILASRTRPWLA
jgi:hypothetical protein